ncbi:response regulator [Euhalothece natronophila Z-M001]|uniref:Response regulator n=1 Tax=Euhalothece natronophila Z-M001 TaxID=522448 RepID=A0A5B8NJX9_9CHRO|nr:response regulator [Euhalothece natronophila]QDZ39623.1 response regulator [Euhalothece natronophila Z-M001]
MSNAVLVVQKNNSDHKIWEKMLESQNLVAITESPQANLRDLIMRNQVSGQSFPKLMILDMSIEHLNPYEFCRWVQENYPSLKIILTNQERKTISDIERRWATSQGAYELIPGFDYNNLPSSLSERIKLVLKALGKWDNQEKFLVPVVEDLMKHLFPQQYEESADQETSPSQSEAEEKQLVTANQSNGSKSRGYKLKPKVKRFRGLPY